MIFKHSISLFMLVIKTVDNEEEPVFTLTAPPREHVAMIVRCMNDGMGNITMCLSLKLYLGHVHYLDGICDYIFVPRIDNFGTYNQTCTNFLGLYDMVANLFKTPLLTYNIDEMHHETEMKAFLKLGATLGKGKVQTKIAYFNSVQKVEKEKKKKRKLELLKLS